VAGSWTPSSFTRDQAEWRRVLDMAGLVFGIVADMDERIHEDEQILASGVLVGWSKAEIASLQTAGVIA
jgi:hypothetical protein